MGKNSLFFSYRLVLQISYPARTLPEEPPKETRRLLLLPFVYLPNPLNQVGDIAFANFTAIQFVSRITGKQTLLSQGS